MKKIFLLLFVLSFGFFYTQSTEEIPASTLTENPETQEIPNRWTYGGNIILNFGSSQWLGSGFNFGLSGRLGYKISPNVESGAVGGFLWNNNDAANSFTLSPGVFTNFFLGENFFVAATFQQYFIRQKIKFNNEKRTLTEPALFLGAGYNLSLGGRTFTQLSIQYNVLYKKNSSIFTSPFFPSVGVVFGL